MTTDQTSADDRTARLEALRQRRAATSAAPPAPPSELTAANPVPRGRARRRHAATGGRILAGSLSAAAALGLMGAMAHATRPSTDTSTTETPADPAAAPTVIVTGRPAGATVAAPAAPPVTPTASAPVTSSRGS